MRALCIGLAVWSILLSLVVSSTAAEKETKPTTISWVRVAQDNRSFVLHPSDQPFAPWGFNYDHDEKGRLLEDYWDKEWPKVEADFQEMKQLGANVVRVHLQFGKFMTGPEKPNEANLERLGHLVALAEQLGLYLVFHSSKVEKGYSKKGYCDLDHTLAMAKRIKAARMRFLLDFHYGDTWTDPGHQIKPMAWANLHGAELEKVVHDYTRDVVAALKKQGTPPDIVQIGNEISNGFLWPDGNVWKSGKWDVFCGLIKAGIAGAKKADPSVKTMIHLAWGGQSAQSRSFLDKAVAQGVEFDIIRASLAGRCGSRTRAQSATRYPASSCAAGRTKRPRLRITGSIRWNSVKEPQLPGRGA
jgi:hypothetical protein